MAELILAKYEIEAADRADEAEPEPWSRQVELDQVVEDMNAPTAQGRTPDGSRVVPNERYFPQKAGWKLTSAPC